MKSRSQKKMNGFFIRTFFKGLEVFRAKKYISALYFKPNLRKHIGAIKKKATFWAFKVQKHTTLSGKKVKIVLDIIGTF